MYPQDMCLNERFKQLSQDFDEQIKNIALHYANRTTDILNKQLNKVITKNIFVIGICLTRKNITTQTLTKLLKLQIRSAVSQILNLLNDHNSSQDNILLESYNFLETQLFHQMSMMNVQKLSESELNYIQRLQFLGQLPHDVAYEKLKRGSAAILDGIIDATSAGELKITSIQGQVFKTYLVLNITPDYVDHCRLFEQAQHFNFPVEVHIKSRFKSNTNLNRKRQRYLLREKETAKDEKATNISLSNRRLDNFKILEKLGNELDNQAIFVEWLACIVIYAEDTIQLKERSQQVVQYFMHQQYHFIQPTTDQLTLFYLFLLGEKLNYQNHWIQLTTIEGMSEMLFGITQNIGTQVGFYIGRIDNKLESVTHQKAILESRDIVLFHPFLANKNNENIKKISDSPHISITGKTGSGKSFLMKLLFYISMLFNVKVLYFDPKNEFQLWQNKIINNKEVVNQYPLFIDLLKEIKYVTLDYTKENNIGILDPIVFLQGDEAKELMKGIFDEIYDFSQHIEIETALLKAIDYVITERSKNQQVGALHVIRYLQQSESKRVADVGENLCAKAQQGLLKLIFSNGCQQTLALNNKSTILQIYGLDLPDNEISKNNYSTSEKNSVIIMLIIAKFMEQFGKHPQEQTAIFFDESWLLNMSTIGQKLLNSLKRMGRSMNNALIFGSQSVKDTESYNNHGNFGCFFAFDNDKEREAILYHLGLDKDNEKSIDMLKKLLQGQCIFKDFYGNVAKLTIHSIFEEWTQSFQTVETTISSELESKYKI